MFKTRLSSKVLKRVLLVFGLALAPTAAMADCEEHPSNPGGCGPLVEVIVVTGTEPQPPSYDCVALGTCGGDDPISTPGTSPTSGVSFASAIDLVRKYPVLCKRATESCDAWKARADALCNAQPPAAARHCSTAVEIAAGNGCTQVPAC